MNKIYKYRFLILRRFVQIGILVLYFGANAYGWRVLTGNLSSSLVFDFIPLSDPYATVQMLCAGAVLGSDIFVGVLIIVAFYGIFGGRAFCSWVCPINMVTDLASYIRKSLHWDKMERKVWLKRDLRYWILGLSLVVSFATKVASFEMVSPIGILTRGIIFGMGMGFAAIVCIFLFDLLVLKNGWCGYICPLGGSYSIIGKFSRIRVVHEEKKCTRCMECKLICPEKQVLKIIGKKDGYITDGECINCGRCIEVCNDNALSFGFVKKIGESDEK